MTLMELDGIVKQMCAQQVALAREIMEEAGADSTPMAACVSRIACTVLEAAELATRHGSGGGSQEPTLTMLMSYGTDLLVASAALRATRSLEARLRVVESQLKKRTDLDDRLRTVEAELTRRLPDADLH